MNNSDIRDQAYQFFIEEAPELLQVMETGLLNIRQDKSTPKVHELMRAAHSIKGGAASVGLEAIKTLAHRLEDFFKALYKEDTSIDLELENLLLQAFDCLRQPLDEQIHTGSFDPETALAIAEPIFIHIEEKLGDALNDTDNYLPSSSDLGIDIAVSIFEVDVAEGIEHLEDVIENPQTYNITEEVKAQAEIFVGFGELLNLPGFVNFAQHVILAIEQHPHKSLEIAQLMLADCIANRQALLAGEKEKVCIISPALMQLTRTHPPQISEPVTENSPKTQLNPVIQEQAYHFFIEEAKELLFVIESGLLTIRQEKTTNKVHELMRAAHSIKGGAASVGLEAIKTIAHSLEDFFKALYKEDTQIDIELESLFLQAFDCLNTPLLEQINTGSFDSEGALAIAEPIFAQIEEKLGDALSEVNDYIPSSSDLGVDIVSSIFEIDVAQELSRLADVVANPQGYEVIGELRALAEVFQGFGELLNLPGFKAIAETSLLAIENYPEIAVQIGQLMLFDFTNSREKVLAGDRLEGGKPSTHLLELAENRQSTNEIAIPKIESQEQETASIDEVFDFSQLELTVNELVGQIEPQEQETASINEVFDIDQWELSIADIFSEAQPQEQETASIDEVFDIDQWQLSTTDLVAETELIEQPRASIDEIFNIAQLENIETDKIASPEIIETQLFDINDLSNIIEQISNPEIETIITPTLEDVFSYVEINESIIPDISQGEIVAPNISSLEEVFGDSENLEISSIINSQELSSPQIPTLEDIFGYINEPITETETENKIPSLENVFGNLETNVLDNQLANEIEKVEEIPSINEVFGGFEIDNLAINQIPEEVNQEKIPSLEDVFAISELTGLADQINSEIEELGEKIPSLEDVFGRSDLQAFNEIITEEKTRESKIPTLDEVFGNLQEEEINQINVKQETTTEEIDDSAMAAFNQIVFSLESDPEKTTEKTEEIDDSAMAAFNQTLSSLQINSSTNFLIDEDVEHSLIDSFNEVVPTENLHQSAIVEIEQKNLNLELERDDSNLGQIENKEKQPNKTEIENTVEEIEQIFEKLPSLQESYIKIDSKKTIKTEDKKASYTSSKIEEKSKRKTNPGTSLSVKVELQRLENMNNLVGELVINRNSLSLQNEQLQGNVKELLNRFSRFRKMSDKLREISDKMLVAPLTYAYEQPSYIHGSGHETKIIPSDFDSLEMDNYGIIHAMLQELLEEMMQIEESVDDLVLFAKQSDLSTEQQRQMLTRLRDELMWARMLPLGEVLNRFPRMLRDLSTTYNKPVKIKIGGNGVLVDKAALEKLYDPLLHLIRNSFDHGIESREIRLQQGKPEEGTIEVRAYHKSNQTVIEIIDDGQGLDLEKIGNKALELGFLTKEQLAVTSKSSLLELIFEPGFSTAAKVSELSGRGVGLDVVRSQVRSLKGSITVNTSPQEGTTFILRLPLTLTLANLLVCLVGSGAVAVPSDSIEEIIVPSLEQIRISGKQRFLYADRQIIPIYRLIDLLEYNTPLPENFSSKALQSVPIPEDWASPLLLMRRGLSFFALEVDTLVTEQELVIKPFGTAISAPRYTYGCTILADGTLIPVINGSVLVEQVLEPSPSRETIPSLGDVTQTPVNNQRNTANVKTIQGQSILIVDDSTAMRRTLAMTLEKAGYRVIQAKDGKEGLEQLQKSTNVKLVICDIEMPNMNGFEFLGQRRRDPQLLKTPVAMLTSRSNDKHRRLAMQLGANAYFTKPYIEQEFTEAINKIINQNVPIKE